MLYKLPTPVRMQNKNLKIFFIKSEHLARFFTIIFLNKTKNITRILEN